MLDSFDLAFFMFLLALYFKSPLIVSGALMLVLWTFVLDVFVAKYLERKELGG